MTALLVSSVLALCVLLAVGRMRESARLRRFQDIAKKGAATSVANLELDVGVTAFVAQDSLEAAEDGCRRGDREETLAWMSRAARLLEEKTPERIGRLKGMVQVTRLAGAYYEPQGPVRFRLRQLAPVAGLATALDAALVGGPERFALRMALLAYGYKTALRLALKSHASLMREAAERDRDKAAFWDALLDWGVCDAEHLESFKALFAPKVR